MAANSTYHDDEDNELPEHVPFLDPPHAPEIAASFPTGRFQLYTLGVIMVLVFVFDFTSSLTGASVLRIFESIICHDYYMVTDPSRIGDGGLVDERHCKVDPVQEELAVLTGWESFFNTLPGLFLAIPFGVLADKYGRKWLMVLNVISICLKALWTFVVCAFPHTFPIRMIWLNGAFGIVGGGTLITIILFVVVVTDITRESERYIILGKPSLRSSSLTGWSFSATVFFYTRSLIFISSLMGQPLGSVLMAHDPWIPLKIGLIVNVVGFLFVLALPETLKGRKPYDSSLLDDLHHGDLAEMPLAGFDPSTPYSSSTQHPNKWRRARAFLATFLRDSRFLVQDWRIFLILSTVAASTFADVSGILHLPYVSKRYTWPLSQAAYLTSFRAGISIIALLIALPAASRWLRRRKAYTVFGTNLLLARASLTLATAGLLLMGFAPSIGPFFVGLFLITLSAGQDALLQSMLSSLVPPTGIARLFTVTGIVQTVAMLAAAPLLTGLYRWGLQQAGNVWIGSPFVCCGVISGGALAMIWLLQIERRTIATGGGSI